LAAVVDVCGYRVLAVSPASVSILTFALELNIYIYVTHLHLLVHVPPSLPGSV
jgi:hypothetical protein